MTGLRGAEGPPTPSGENRAFNPHPQGRKREHPSFDGVSLVYKCKDSDPSTLLKIIKQTPKGLLLMWMISTYHFRN